MKFGKIEEHGDILDKVRRLPVAVISRVQTLGLWQTLNEKASFTLPLISILALTAGILLGAFSDGLSNAVNTAADGFIEGYSYGAPIIIFVVLVTLPPKTVTVAKRVLRVK